MRDFRLRGKILGFGLLAALCFVVWPEAVLAQKFEPAFEPYEVKRINRKSKKNPEESRDHLRLEDVRVYLIPGDLPDDVDPLRPGSEYISLVSDRSGETLDQLPGTFAAPKLYVHRIPISLQPNVALWYRRMYGGDAPPLATSEEQTAYVEIVVDRPEQCEELIAAKSGDVLRRVYRVCSVVEDTAYEMVNPYSGPFYHRQSLNFWLTGGLAFFGRTGTLPGYVGESFSNGLGFRLDGGVLIDRLELEYKMRRYYTDFTGAYSYRPSTDAFSAAFGYEFPSRYQTTGYWTHYVAAVAGLSTSNTSLTVSGKGVTATSNDLLTNMGFRYRPIYGLRSDFQFDVRYYYGTYADGFSFENDWRFWLHPRLCWGLGYHFEMVQTKLLSTGYNFGMWGVELFTRVAF